MKLEVYADKGGKHRWRVLATNGQTVCSGGEAFASRGSATKAGENFLAKAATWKFDVYADKGGKSRWRAVSPRNGQTVAASGQPFSTRSNAVRAAKNVKDRAVKAAGA